MRTSQFTREQIIGFLGQTDTGMAEAESRRAGGFSGATRHTWRAKFSGMDVSHARRLRQLEVENTKRKHRLAETRLDLHALRGVLGAKKSRPRPGAR